MASTTKTESDAPLDLSKWRNVPNLLILVGGALSVLCVVLGLVKPHAGFIKQFGFSWLLAFMFFLSLCLGGLILTLFHHLFDASWSVPVRRINEQLMSLFPTMAVLFLPIAILAPKYIYGWMSEGAHPDHALTAKFPLFTTAGFYLVIVFNFGVWSFLGYKLRYWSLKQDETGAAECTLQMRFYSFIGIFLFAITTTLAAIMWMKALQHQWFSTMYGVWYFAGSTWVTLATLYLITVVLKRQGPLRAVIGTKQIYFIGSLLFAFTVFHAYITFAQYFIIWNANMPEETFWYVWRERGSWFWAGVVIILGHFFVPFLGLLRIDVKQKLWWMLPIIIWAWIMHFLDLSFNIIPVIHPSGFIVHWMDLAAMAVIGGVFAKVFIKNFNAHPPYPQRDPRMAEGLDVYVPPAGAKPLASTGGAH